MCKKAVKRLIVMLAAVCMMFTMSMPALASEQTGDSGSESSGVTGTTEDPANGILQVMLAYVDDGGNRTYFTGGTCFLINEEYVLTNKHVFDLDTPDATTGMTTRETIMETMGLSELPDNDSHLKLYVFANRDTNVEATVHENAQSDVLDFAALKLSERIYEREPLVLGDSDQIHQRDNIYAYGFPADSIQNKNFNTKDDVSISSGIISKVTVTGSVDVIEHTAQLNNGNSGGPLLNEAGQVVGINEFIVDQKNYSIQINAVKEVLDTWGVAYDGNGGAEGVTLEDLQSRISAADALETADYTPESVQAFENAVSDAKTVAAGNPSTEEIQAAMDAIASAQSALVEKQPEEVAETDIVEEEGPNFLLIGGIAALVLVIIVVVIIIVVVSKNGKKKNAAAIPPGPTPGPIPPQPPVRDLNDQFKPYGEEPTVPQGMEGAGETTLLDSGAGETTLLGGGSGAYLIRKKNGEKVMITSPNFAIGKERRRVNYCISDNTSVSRYHAVITRKGADYFVEDQNSSNFTYVNGVQLSPRRETLLTDKSILKLADEEFEFHLS